MLTPPQCAEALQRLELPVCDTENLETYLDECLGYNEVSGEESLELSRKIREGDQAALRRQVLGQFRLTLEVAKEFESYGARYYHMLNCGTYALTRAAAKFDPDRGYKFPTYATWWLRAAIWNAVAWSWSEALQNAKVASCNPYARPTGTIRSSKVLDDRALKLAKWVLEHEEIDVAKLPEAEAALPNLFSSYRKRLKNEEEWWKKSYSLDLHLILGIRELVKPDGSSEKESGQ